MQPVALPVPTSSVPALPVAAIRLAIAGQDWTQATSLLAAHQHELADAMDRVDWSTADRGPWMDLLIVQRELTAELERQRVEVADALARLNEDHRGARAWLRELA